MLVIRKGMACAPGEYNQHEDNALRTENLKVRRVYDAMLRLHDPEYTDMEMAIRTPVLIVCRPQLPHTDTLRIITFAHVDLYENPERPNITSQITEEGFLSPTEPITYEGLRVPTGYFLPRRQEEEPIVIQDKAHQI